MQELDFIGESMLTMKLYLLKTPYDRNPSLYLIFPAKRGQQATE